MKMLVCLRSAISRFFIALSFLTIIPIKKICTQKELKESIYFFPFIGLGIGACSMFLLKVFEKDPLFASIIVVGFWVLITGAFHLDGVADVADALAKNKEEALVMMKDKRIGTFGAVALFFLLILKIYSINALSGKEEAVLICPFFARFMMLLSAFISKSAKKDGHGYFFAHSMHFLHLLPSLFLAIFLLYIFKFAIIPSFLSFLWTLFLCLFFHSWIGGITGDCLGTVCETSEVFFLLFCTFF